MLKVVGPADKPVVPEDLWLAKSENNLARVSTLPLAGEIKSRCLVGWSELNLPYEASNSSLAREFYEPQLKSYCSPVLLTRQTEISISQFPPA